MSSVDQSLPSVKSERVFSLSPLMMMICSFNENGCIHHVHANCYIDVLLPSSIRVRKGCTLSEKDPHSLLQSLASSGRLLQPRFAKNLAAASPLPYAVIGLGIDRPNLCGATFRFRSRDGHCWCDLYDITYGRRERQKIYLAEDTASCVCIKYGVKRSAIVHN